MSVAGRARHAGATAPASSAPGRWALSALLLAACLHAAFLISLPTGFLNPLFVEASEGLRQASDFFGIYQAGSNLARGFSIYDSDDYLRQAPRVVPFFYYYRYLPPTAYLTAPAALLLPPWPAYWLWVLACEFLLGLVVASILRQEAWPRSRRLWVAALWIGSFPFYLEQVMGQFSIVMAVFLWMLWRWDPQGGASPRPMASATATRGGTATEVEVRNSSKLREPPFHAAVRGILDGWRDYRWRTDRVGRAGLLLGWVGSLSLKSYTLFLVLPYFRDRRLKLILLGLGGTLALSLPYFLFHPGDLQEFIRLNFTPFTPTLHKGSYGLHNLIRYLLFAVPDPALQRTHPIGPLQLNALGATLLLICLVLLVLAARASLRLLHHPNRIALDLGIWTTAFFLVFKSIWEYHYVMLLPAVAALYLTTGSRIVLAAGALLQLPTLYAMAPALAGVAPASSIETWPRWFGALHLSVKSLPTLALYLWCLRQATNPPPNPTDST